MPPSHHPPGEGLEVRVQGQLAEWPQKPRLPLCTSDPIFHTSLQPPGTDQFAAFFRLIYVFFFTHLFLRTEIEFHTVSAAADKIVCGQ